MLLQSLLGLRALALVLAVLGSAAGAAVQRRGSAGCSQPHDWAGQTREFSFRSRRRMRTYRIHLPSTYEANSSMPLLVAYHGRGNTPAKFERQTRFSNETINPSMITVYPAGVGRTWQGPSYATSGVSDKVFTTDLVNRIKANYCIDEARVYATGHSNGAGFLGTLACSPGHGGQFAAFAPISGAFYTNRNRCNPSRLPVPILEVHGTADRVIPYDGGRGRGGKLPSVTEWLSKWALRNQCGEAATTGVTVGVNDSKWTCGGVAGLLEHVKLDGHGHRWPGPNNSAVDVSPLVIQFLSAFTRDNVGATATNGGGEDEDEEEAADEGGDGAETAAGDGAAGEEDEAASDEAAGDGGEASDETR